MIRNSSQIRYKSTCYQGSKGMLYSDKSLAVDSDACPQVLFFFMDRFSSSRSWRTARELAAKNDWFDNQNIVVILVGDYRHLLPATRLAAEMKLPFLLLADHDGSLWNRYGKPQFKTSRRQDAYILVDLCGRVQYSHGNNSVAFDSETEHLFEAISKVH